MHELPVMKSILDIVVKQAQMNSVRKVRAIQLEVGMLSDLEEEWMQRYFDYLSKDTIAQKAELRIQWIPIAFQCQDCKKSFEVERKRLQDVACPSCGQKKLTLVSGREYRIKNMEVE
jgi:hydrogenase nickel incorporation protein HypA/HybF